MLCGHNTCWFPGKKQFPETRLCLVRIPLIKCIINIGFWQNKVWQTDVCTYYVKINPDKALLDSLNPAKHFQNLPNVLLLKHLAIQHTYLVADIQGNSFKDYYGMYQKSGLPTKFNTLCHMYALQQGSRNQGAKGAQTPCMFAEGALPLLKL